MSLEKSDKLLQSNWGWILGLGILFMLLGCIGLGMAVGLTLVSMLFFGVLMMIAGFSHMIDVIRHKHWKGMIWHAFIAVLYIIGGIIVFDDPVLASKILTAMLAGVLIVIGLTRIIMALSLRQETGWGWLLLAGIAALILGFLIFIQWPFSALWVIGMFIAIELIVTGWTYILIAFSMKKA